MYQQISISLVMGYFNFIVVTHLVLPLCVYSQDDLCDHHLVCVPQKHCGWKDLGDEKNYKCGTKYPSYICCPASHATNELGHPYGRSSREVKYNGHPSRYEHQTKNFRGGYDRKGYGSSYRHDERTQSHRNKYQHGSNGHDPFYMDFYHDQYEKFFGYSLSPQGRELLRNYRAREECGVRNRSPANLARVATGYLNGYGLTSFAEFPWHAAILEEQRSFGYGKQRPLYRYICGATLIHKSLLITAAHCVRSIVPYKLMVHLGDWNLLGSTGELFPAIKRKISKVFIHSGYNPSTYKNDIALLQMSKPVDTYKTPHISPVCLPEVGQLLKDHSECFVVGWGDDIYKPNFGTNILKSVSVSYASGKECSSRLFASLDNVDDEFTLDKDSQKCIFGSYGKDACVGDGGGGVVCPLKNDDGPDVCNTPHCAEEHYFLFGVISYGSPRCGENSVTIISDVVENLNWVYTALKPAGGLKNYDDLYFSRHRGRSAGGNVYERSDNTYVEVNGTSTN